MGQEADARDAPTLGRNEESLQLRPPAPRVSLALLLARGRWMSVTILAGTAKGAAVLRSDESRRAWSTEALALPGWKVTAAARDAGGRYYVAITGDTYGAAIMVSDDLRSFRQLESAPRYRPGDRGNRDHTRLIGASLPSAVAPADQRHLDQIWTLFAAPDALYAGVSEAGLFASHDRGETWASVSGLNDHPGRADWEPGFGGLCLHAILQDGRDPRRLWVGISAAGVLRSDDGGASWELKNDGVSRDSGCCVHAIAHDPAHADLIYRQDHRGMYLTEDGGDHWRLIETGLPRARLSDDRECAFEIGRAHV
jgi:hypothetical protein